MISQIENSRRPHPSDSVLRKLEDGLGRPHGFLTAPEIKDPSFELYLESDYGHDDAPTPDEIERLRSIQWKGPSENAPPSAWHALLEAIRRQRGGLSE